MATVPAAIFALNYACNEANETVGRIGRTIISSLFL
jgi:hypothetical protein